jgi:hypothetical protein
MDGLEEPELNIHVVAQTREALSEELQNHISMSWDEYPVDAESDLSPVALALRARLRAAIEVARPPAVAGRNRDAPSVFRVDPRQGVEMSLDTARGVRAPPLFPITCVEAR